MEKNKPAVIPSERVPMGRRWLARAPLLVAFVAALVLPWFVFSWLAARAVRAELPPLPNLSASTPAILRQLSEADARARGNPRSGEAVGNLAMVYHANAFRDEARVAYRLAISNQPDAFRWPYSLAVLELTVGENESARDLLSRSVELNPEAADAWVRLGQLLFRAGAHDDAERAFQEALKRSPSHPHAAVGMARVLGLRDQWSRVVVLLERAVQAYPQFGPAHRVLVVAYEHLGQTEDRRRHEGIGAEIQINDALMNELYALSSTGSILVTKAKIAETWGNLKRSEQLLRRAVAVAPEDKDVRLAIGKFLWEHTTTDWARLQEAKGHLEAGLAVDSGFVAARMYYGSVLKALGDATTAREQWLKVLEQEPDHAQSLMMLGQLHFAQNDYGRARDYYRRGLDVPRDTPFMLGNRAPGLDRLGLSCWRLGRTDEALEAFRQALDTDPRYLETYKHYGRLLKSLGRADEAMAVLQQGVAENPRSAELRLAFGNHLLQVHRYEEAHEQLRFALSRTPRDARVLAALGLAKLRLDDVDGAIEHLRAALDVNPNFHLAHFHLGSALLRKNEREEAVNHFETALRLRPGFEPARRALEQLKQP